MTGFRRIKQGLARSMQRQVTDSDCAVWVIKAMCLQLGVSVPPARTVREHIDLDQSGTTVLGVRDALDHFGINAQPVAGPSNAIAAAPLPAIAMIRIHDVVLHYVVVIEATKRRVRYLDPAFGGIPKSVSCDEFAKLFTGKLILCERKPDYTKLDFEQEIDAKSFTIKALLTEWNSVLAFTFGELFQLTTLLIGVLLLKSFFASSLQGAPNFWFVGGIAICAAIYVWIGRLKGLISIQLKSKTLLSLLAVTTNLFRQSICDLKSNVEASSARCLKSVTASAAAIVSIGRLPSHLINVIAFIGLLIWIDPYAAGYATIVAIILPLIFVLISSRCRSGKRDVTCQKERVLIGLMHLSADRESKNEAINDIGWGQIRYCDSLAKRDIWQSVEATTPIAVGRLNVFAGLLIGGLQHETMGMSHTVAVFILLSIYSSVLCQWARNVAVLPECIHQVRGWLDFISDLNPSVTNYNAFAKSNLAGLDVSVDSDSKKEAMT